jgi:uncharacterized protein
MNCPACKTSVLVMSERQGIQIDYCPQCRGVWLDRGELDKIVERSANVGRPATAAPRQPGGERGPHEPLPGMDDLDDDDFERPPHVHKRKSWLSELFD